MQATPTTRIFPEKHGCSFRRGECKATRRAPGGNPIDGNLKLTFHTRKFSSRDVQGKIVNIDGAAHRGRNGIDNTTDPIAKSNTLSTLPCGTPSLRTKRLDSVVPQRT